MRELLADPRCTPHTATGELCVALSGGADSLALTAAAVHVARKSGLRVRTLTVDHGLQSDSSAVAHWAADQARGLGVDRAEVLDARVGRAGGPEAAARAARYAALHAHNAGSLVLLGHTRDDQAETVLLGLGRGSGPRSIAGMSPLEPPWGRALLGVSRATTDAACAALGLRPWRDPHNSDPRFTRVRIRTEVLPLLEDVLAGGVAGALTRTAGQLREDTEVLDALAAELRMGAETETTEIDVATMTTAAAAVRRRVLRRWLLDVGVPELTEHHLRSVDALIGAWRGQGEVWLPGAYSVRRIRDRLRVFPPEGPLSPETPTPTGTGTRCTTPDRGDER